MRAYFVFLPVALRQFHAVCFVDGKCCLYNNSETALQTLMQTAQDSPVHKVAKLDAKEFV